MIISFELNYSNERHVSYSNTMDIKQTNKSTEKEKKNIYLGNETIDNNTVKYSNGFFQNL